ncbi:uncharacterized protein UV8b_07107 [Ustilaginoidea virens]|uniref:Cyclase n=1 Tax=Ustilaginoidea virens TaxID=1159556 RepID=A0A8E5MKG9_USTVR|nr:uncharacterized protein UV8b_07107 [Ustilaginoidea virens]QUC22866.1 hypothetical protein UV8b_07107 [Ustilaginoidea virens]
MLNSETDANTIRRATYYPESTTYPHLRTRSTPPQSSSFGASPAELASSPSSIITLIIIIVVVSTLNPAAPPLATTRPQHAMPPRPTFDELPVRKDGPPGNAWGLYGDGDECGTLNLLTPERVARAAREIVHGVRVSTDWHLDSMSPPCFGRRSCEHTITHKAPMAVNDDELRLNTQSSSQWDGLRHFGYQDEKLYYNGMSQDEVLSTHRNGIHAWVEKGGVVGRGVLLDYAAWADAKGLQLKPLETVSIPVSALDQVAASQGTTLQAGDILFVRVGWTREYQKQSPNERAALASKESPPAMGLESSEETLRWIWDKELAAIAGDHPSMEAWPCQNMAFQLHPWLLAGWGMPIGELFDLERLSEECSKRQRWTFFFSSMPLKVPGGVASPPNGVAIF